MNANNDPMNTPTPESQISPISVESAISIAVAADQLSALLTVRPYNLKGETVSKDKLWSIIQDWGIHRDRMLVDEIRNVLLRLDDAAKRNDFTPIKVEIAKGQPPVPGENGWVRFYHPMAKRVKLLEDGRADYRNIDRYINVKAGEKLATLFEGIPGTPGFDVFGNIIPPPSIKRPKLMIGKNIEEKQVVENGKELKDYLAASNGVIFATETSITVSPELQIAGNVGLSTGNIQFEGNVIVRGDIEPGSVVECTGSLIVYGNLESNTIKVGQDLVVHGGIKGTSADIVRVAGRVQAKFIENSHLETEGDIVIEGAVLNSTVDTLGSMILNGSNGNLVSSKVRTNEGISLSSLGSSAELDVSIELGFHFKNDRSFQEISRKVVLGEKEMEKILPKIQQIKHMVQRSRGNLPDDKKAVFKSVFEDYNKKLKILNMLKYRQDELKSARFNPGAVRLAIQKGAYPGAVIHYRRQVEKITKFQSSFMMVFEPGQDKAMMVALQTK
ncbi:FapA family protein [Leptospira ellisii]|uniref:FapA family protein n=1 Tax=Leptospira ellisii TaxID=2023197 RepID=A0A2N0B540_9LEPT|nr:FapA family protein [Leptospira ellisii]MDV6235109.1 FapA family protein [Leptospira ellisii]PJZ91659.1 polymerase [Leptospira ellisii]PKA04569.1 polymerase [Leptospira ellisii]